MTRADCQALSKHHHVCWLSIPCSQHKIGGQRIIGVRDGKDIWGQPVHASTFSCPWFQIIPCIIFSPPALVQFSRSSLSPGCHLWGMMLEALSSFSSAKRDIACAPVDIHELLCWWSQLRGWRLTGSFSAAWQWGFSRQNWGVFSVDDVGEGEKGWGTVQPYHCWLCSLVFL